ncbi:Gfo/Idh/MocA family oxidoreductase [Algoriphagus sp. CAU 1675]|uniref:Gfo/Idh/MocA family protein n=1 Tax=Algoriphagus sp. CAU 1675 TaxID=3032597 RepID=UPI0023D99113|nr:Gfo/Idh/MocA family oxidoreductase [Algoriphagus sp. CAU 1675]MDF2159082.1 Gfo/Idh/MocA family oxidoreductase [Algoriphagus sp. CAU 1675]
MKDLGIGIIGTGSITGKHLEAIATLDHAKVLALHNPKLESAQKAAVTFGLPVYSDLEEFLALPGLDIVCVCTPSGLHLEPALAAARAGKHVVVEKPLEINLSRVDQLVSACEDNGVRLEVIFQNRFSPDYLKLKEAVERGEFGRLLMGNAYINWFRTPEYYSQSIWKGTLEGDGGGAFINQGIHTLDLLLDIMGDVKSVFGKVKTALYPIEGEDLGAAMVTFKNGAIGNITAATSLYPGYPERLEIYGTEGSAILEAGKIVAWNIKGKESLVSSKDTSSSGASDPTAIGSELHAAQWSRFLEAIQNDSPNLVNGKEGRKSVELIRAIYKSSELNQELFFPFEDS